MHSLKHLIFAGGLLLSHSSWGEPKHALDQQLDKNSGQEQRESAPRVPHKPGVSRPQQEESEQEITLEKILYDLGRQDKDAEPQNTFEKLSVRERNLDEKVTRWQKNIDLVYAGTSEDKSKAVQDMVVERDRVWDERRSVVHQVNDRIAAVMKARGYSPVSDNSHTFQSKSGKSVFNVFYNINSGKIELQKMSN